MKHFLLISLLITATSIQAVTPSWIRKIPTASNNTFYYKVESAVAPSEEVALNKAMGRVILAAVQSLGLPVNSSDVEKAIADGSVVRSFATNYRIPIRHVCTYRMKANGGNVRVFVLCQVGVSALVEVEFEDFNRCGPVGDLSAGGSDSNLPQEWDKYMNDDRYEWVLKQDDVEKGQDLKLLDADLRVDAKLDLANRLGVPDTSRLLGQLIRYESYSYNKKEATLSILAHIEKDRLRTLYHQMLKESIRTTHALLDNAESRAHAEDYNGATAECKMAEANMDVSKRFIRVLETYHADEMEMDNYRRQLKNLKTTIDNTGKQYRKQRNNNREKKLQSLLETADKAEYYDRKMGSALQYYYAALAYMATLDNTEHLKFKSDFDHQPAHDISTWLEGHIRDILRNVYVEAILNPQNRTEADIYFYWDATNKEPAIDISYRYNFGFGMGEYTRITDHVGYAELPAGRSLEKIDVQLDYRFDGEWGDPEIARYAEQCEKKFDKEATHTVALKRPEKPVEKPKDAMAETVLSKHSSRTMENADIKPINLDKIIGEVCQAIEVNNTESVKKYFTSNGQQVFDALMRTGKVHVHNATNYRLVSFCNETYVRSIPMTITYRQGKCIQENVVLVFNADMKIDGIQFALDQTTAKDILGRPAVGLDGSIWSDTIKCSIVNFLENYRTAYTLKRLDYIQSLFADNAIIIVGRVLKQQKQMEDGIGVAVTPEVKYDNIKKEEYINRLANTFRSNEWINVRFANADVSTGRGMHGIQLKQSYASTHYGDEGYLFLIVDFSKQDTPVIHLRAWDPEGMYGFEDYDRMLQEQMSTMK